MSQETLLAVDGTPWVHQPNAFCAEIPMHGRIIAQKSCFSNNCVVSSPTYGLPLPRIRFRPFPFFRGNWGTTHHFCYSDGTPVWSLWGRRYVGCELLVQWGPYVWRSCAKKLGVGMKRFRWKPVYDEIIISDKDASLAYSISEDYLVVGVVTFHDHEYIPRNWTIAWFGGSMNKV